MSFTKEEKDAITVMMGDDINPDEVADILDGLGDGTPLCQFIKDNIDPALLKEPPVLEPDTITDKDGNEVPVAKKKMTLLYMIFGPLLTVFHLMPNDRMGDFVDDMELKRISYRSILVSLPLSMLLGYSIGVLCAIWIATKWIAFVVSVILAFCTGFIMFYIVRGLYEYISTSGKGVGHRA